MEMWRLVTSARGRVGRCGRAMKDQSRGAVGSVGGLGDSGGVHGGYGADEGAEVGWGEAASHGELGEGGVGDLQLGGVVAVEVAGDLCECFAEEGDVAVAPGELALDFVGGHADDA